MRRAFVLLPLVLLAACHAIDVEPQPYRGNTWQGFESSLFQPEGTTELWWLSGDLSPLSPLWPEGAASEHACFTLEVRGYLSPAGRYGHLGCCPRELVVQRVLSAEPRPDAQPRDCIRRPEPR